MYTPADVGDDARVPEEDDVMASEVDSTTGEEEAVDDSLRGLGGDDDLEADFEIADDADDLDFELDEEEEGLPSGFAELLAGEQPAAGGPEVDEGLIDLKTDQQMAIDLAFDGIDKTFYEILLLPRSADEKAIKRSYYRLSKEYHPDKYYRKRLGAYKERIEVIFNKVNEAYRVLSDPEARDDYDVLVFGKEGKDAASPTEATATVNFLVDAFKQESAAKAGKAKVAANKGKVRKGAPAKFMTDFQQQVAERIVKARRHMKAGEKAAAAGDHQKAASHFQAAMTLDPRSLRAKAKYNKSQAQHRNTKAAEFHRQAQDALLAENTKRAAELMQKAVDCKPTKGKYYNDFGKLVSAHTLQQRVGLELLRKAVELEARNVEYTMDLARAYEELGMPSNAVRAFERVLYLDSKRSEAAKALKRLK